MSPLSGHEVEYLSKAAPVNMGDHWFEIATLDHFWIRRRFDVLQQLTASFSWKDLRVAEFGCGTGLLQRQLEDAFGIGVDGFDLNASALERNLSRRSRVACYNIFDRLPELRARYDVLFLFDVLEHIEDHAAFLDVTLFHLNPGGHLIINVPANEALFSEYDRAAGHVRRYHSEALLALAASAGLKTVCWTYWGFPMVPLLVARRWFLKGQTDRETILRDGFKPRSSLINTMLRCFSRFERIPQHWRGSSLMVVAARPSIPKTGQKS